MSPRPWKLFEANLAQVRAADYQVAVLPLGATEPHNLHLPYGTDVLEADLVGETICAAAHAQGARVVLLPTIPYGTESNLGRFPLAMNLRPTTLFRVIGDLVETLAGSGIRKVVLLNSHGGNDLKALLRELYGQTPAHVFLCNWYTVLKDCYDEIFAKPDDHAGEMETSLILHVAPELVARDSQGKLAADAGAVQPTRFAAVNNGWVGITRPWHLLTTNSGAGDPHAASADKGRQLLERLTPRLAQFLVELSAAPLDERFPF
ncbi:MAG: creatininase family protein [Pirellulales bacterium]|nr:creatininase family protein [Pirellulales bacterium]